MKTRTKQKVIIFILSVILTFIYGITFVVGLCYGAEYMVIPIGLILVVVPILTCVVDKTFPKEK